MDGGSPDFPTVTETKQNGLQITDGDNRWWITKRPTMGDRPTLVRVATAYDTPEGKTTDMYEVVFDTHGEPLSVDKWSGVHRAINLQAPFTDKPAHAVLQPGGQVMDQSALTALHLGPVRSLQQWKSDRPLPLDAQLTNYGLPDFRANLGKLNPYRFQKKV